MKIEGHPSATSTILSYNLHVTAPDALSQLCCGRTQYIAKRRKINSLFDDLRGGLEHQRPVPVGHSGPNPEKTWQV